MAKVADSSSKPHALAVPLPFQGHIHPLLQLSKRLVSAGFMVTFANTQAAHKRIQSSLNQSGNLAGGGDDGSEKEEDSDLHLVSLEEGIPAEIDNVFDIIAEVLKPGMCTAVANLLARLCEKGPPVTLLIFDFRLSFLLDVAAEANIPSLSFWTQNAASLACNLAVVQGFQPPPDDSTLTKCVEGVPPIKYFEISGVSFDQIFPPFLAARFAWEPFKRIQEPTWIVLNTFEELEATTLNTLHACLGFRPLALGPLVDTPLFTVVKEIKEINNSHTHLEWLQRQSQGSVLYISFGTVINLSEEQIEELVAGIEASQQTILWVFRPKLCGNSKRYTLDTLSRRFMNQGMMVEWVPQLQILLHPSIGGFFTHCGWNSTLEGIIAGVPMLGWPGLVDQFLNKRCIEELWEIGLGFDVDVFKRTFISRIEIERSVRRLMQGPKAEEMRKRARHLSILAKEAVGEGGLLNQKIASFMECNGKEYLKG